jgi:hypothetical protein
MRAIQLNEFDQTPSSCRGSEQLEDDGGHRREGCTGQPRRTGRTQIDEPPVCTENPIGVDDAPESPKLAE